MNEAKDLILKNLNYSGMESWEKVGKTPLISLPYYDTYKGKTYKFTGAFAPVNQILGLLNF